MVNFKDKLKTFKDFKNKQKSVWSNVFWFVKVCIFWKCFQHTIDWDKREILKKFRLDKINGAKNTLLFLSRAPTRKNCDVLLLICDSYMIWRTRFVSLKLCVGFSIFDFVAFLLKFTFLFDKIHGLFDLKTP